jgi:nucleotide-binding universal stress UspA family protein
MKTLVAIEDDMLRGGRPGHAALVRPDREGRSHLRAPRHAPVAAMASPVAGGLFRLGGSDARFLASAKQLLQDAGDRLRGWGIEAECLQEAGDPPATILRVAKERGADLVIVGARGRKARGFMIGSVSQKVKALAEADVLVVKGRAPCDRSTFQVLLPVDGSPEVLRAVDSLATKLRADRAEVTLLHALDLPTLTVWSAFHPRDHLDVSSLPPALQESAERALCPALAALRANGIEAATEIRSGNPAEEILDAAERHHADLIVMGARGLVGLPGLMVGSVTQRVVRHGTTSAFVAR